MALATLDRNRASNAAPATAISHVLGLEEVRENQRPLVGGKAVNLAILQRAGMPVPRSFCVTTMAFDLFLAAFPGRDQLEEIWSRCLAAPIDQFAELSRAAQTCLAPAPIPPAVRTAVLTAWWELGGGGSYAVRSSATVEDAPDRSFAGQFESILNVRGGEAVMDALKACWLSLFSERALVYLTRQPGPLEKIKMAVLIQEMVPADFSGVAFTADPTSGATDRLLVEWVPGLGDSLVQGTQTPRELLIEKRTGAVRKPDGTTDPLPKSVYRPLLALARQAEQLFATPQDLEWAFCAGQVWLLQARPITTLRLPPKTAPTLWSNLNVVENLPNVATPLTWSSLDHFQIRQIDPLFQALGLAPADGRWLGLVAGRVYFNLSLILQALHWIPGFRPEDLAWYLGGHHDADPELLRHQSTTAPASLARRALIMLRVLRLATPLLLDIRWRTPHTCITGLKTWADQLSRIDYEQARAEELLQQLKSYDTGLLRHLPLPGIFLGCGGIFHVLFRRGCQRWFSDKNGAIANRLLSHTGSMASAEPGLALLRIAVYVRQHPPLQTPVTTADHFAPLVTSLGATAPGREFLAQWTAFMRHHGHHAAGELDIAEPRWSERPDEVLRLLQGYLNGAAPCDPRQNLAARRQERERFLRECASQMSNPFKRWWFLFLLRQTQTFILIRENGKNEIIRSLAAFRRICLELGARMVRHGTLETRDDVFFLKFAELEPACYRQVPFDLRAAVAARRAEFEHHRALTPPSLVIGQFDPALQPVPASHQGDVLPGLGVSAGIITGRARVLLQAAGPARLQPGEILVAPYTDPGWTPLFLTAAGLVTDIGGQLSHGSVIAREYGLPAVVNVPHATTAIHTGDLIQVDGDRGIVTIVARCSADRAGS